MERREETLPGEEGWITATFARGSILESVGENNPGQWPKTVSSSRIGVP